MTPEPVERLVATLARLPGVGQKTAQRLAFYILRSPENYARQLSRAIDDMIDKVRLCSRCCSLTEKDPCATCSDPKRDDQVLCVVEGIAEQLAIERTREFRGRYHVLHGALSPLEGIGPDQLRIQELLARLGKEPCKEIIIATNPDIEGEATALYLTKLLKPMGMRVTRIAQGVPMGGELEYADSVTLARALSGRHEI
jgi:recombination protein RecR